MADELIDIYDDNMNLIGSMMKTQAIAEGHWHKVFHCWIVKRNPDNKHKIWLQQRGKDMINFPNCMDATVGGHVGAGEEPKETGIREVQEEIGLSVKEEDLSKLFTYRFVMQMHGNTKKEFSGTYMHETTKELSDVIMQPEEVDTMFEINYHDALKLFTKEIDKAEAIGLVRDENNKYHPKTRTITINDFIPNREEYYQKVFSTIARYFDN